MTQIVTANRLRDGLVVFLRADGEWSERLDEARRSKSETTAEHLMTVARKAVADCQMVDPYLIDIGDAQGGYMPTHQREAIRATGPTVQTNLNRGAHGGHA